jgi:hypothetical protein
MPRAIPETTARFAAARSWAITKANFRASAEALRAPTIATISRFRSGPLPKTAMTGGGGSNAASPRG